MSSIQSKKSRSGKKTHYVVVSHNSTRKWIKAGSYANARRLRSQLDSLEDSKRTEKLGLSHRDARIDDFFQKYADYLELHNSTSTARRYLAVINTFISFLQLYHPGVKRLSQIDHTLLESYQSIRLNSLDLKRKADGERIGIKKVKKLPQPQTVNYEMSVFRSAFIWATNHGLLATVPTKFIRKLRTHSKNAGRILKNEECSVLLKTVKDMALKNDHFGVYDKAFTFLLNTGLRSGELCHLTWRDVDFDTGIIRIQAKNEWSPKTYARQFYLNKLCIEVLQSLDIKSNFIFVDHNKKQLDPDKLRRALARVVKKAGIADFTRVHDLRHTFSSIMQMNGVDAATVSAILGHRSLETTMIYTHRTDEHLKKSIEMIGVGAKL